MKRLIQPRAQRARRFFKRASSLLMLFQRSPAAQVLMPAEFNLAASTAAMDATKLLIATVAGLGAYDSVAGATTLAQLSPSPGSTTLPVTSGKGFTGVFQVTGSPSQPKSWQVVGTLPAGLSLPNVPGATATLSGTTTEVGSKSVTIKAWEKAGFTGGVVQKVFTINVAAAPGASITTQPQPVTINSGGTATLTVVAAGEAPLTYQWYEGTSGDSSAPVGTNAASFTTPALTASTSYWVKVTNATNTTGAASNTAAVTVRQPAAITGQPGSSTITAGQTATLTVTATGDAPFTYQWYEGASGTTTTPVGTNSASFTTPALAATTSYWVKVTNVANTTGALSQTATITVEVPLVPSILTAAALGTVRPGLPYSASLQAAGGHPPYTWAVTNGAVPAGLTLSETGLLSGTPSAQGSSTFTAQVSDNQGAKDTRVFSLAVNSLQVAPQTLPTAVKSVPYAAAVVASGGVPPLTWSFSGGPLPGGIAFSTGGQFAGTPTGDGNTPLTVTVTDSTGYAQSLALVLPVSATYVKPVMNPPAFPVVTVGTSFNHTLTAQNYPKTFTATGLPAGLKLNATTGQITGLPDVSGVYNVQVRATNAAGGSALVTAPLTVKALPRNMVGAFGGLVGREPNVNRNLGGQFSLVVTVNGGYTLKYTGALPSTTVPLGASATSSATGRLAANAPQVSTTLGGVPVTLTLDAANGNIRGNLGAAEITGWRQVWHATALPAEDWAGYYSVALDLSRPADQSNAALPQGTGFLTFTITNAGVATLAGKTADGEAVTASSFLGGAGDFWVVALLNKKLGTLHGPMQLAPDVSSAFAENRAGGALTWLRPATPTHLYAAGFGPLPLAAAGRYLAPSAKGGPVLGLPQTGAVQMLFMDGGVGFSSTKPDTTFTYTDDNKVVMPADLLTNPAKVVTTLGTATGALAGSFTLVETGTGFTRAKVPFQGQVVRDDAGEVKAVGFFLLPQIPAGAQKPADAEVLSGGVYLVQPQALE